MSTAVVAVLAATAALVVAIGGAAVARRASRESRTQCTRGLLELSERLDDLAGELADAVGKAREDALRARIIGSLGGTLDLAEVLTRSAEAASSLPGVAAAAITVAVDGVPMVAAVGVDQDRLGAMTGPPGDAGVRAVGLSYHYRGGPGETGAMRSAVAVPIESEAGRLGFLTVFGREEEPPVAGQEFQTLEAVAHAAGFAIERARANASRPSPETDALTSLPNRQMLHETLALEVARAHRSGRSLTLCVIDADELGATNVRLGRVAADGRLAEIATLLKDTLRPGDRLFRSGGDEFAVLLPDSGRIDAESTFARVQGSLPRAPHPPGSALSLSAGIAELKPDDDGVSLFERAERALHRAKHAGKGSAA